MQPITGKMKRKEIILLSVILFFLITLLLTTRVLIENRSLDTRSKAATNESKIMLPVRSAGDNAFEASNGAVSLNGNSGLIPFGFYQKAVGLRFNSVALASLRGKTITSATLKLKSGGNDSNKVALTIYLEKRASCAAFNTDANNISSRALTTNSVDWDLSSVSWASGETYSSPDFSQLFTEVLSKPAWDGTTLCIILLNKNSAPYQGRSFYNQENPVLAPNLVIKYSNITATTTPTASTSPTPVTTNIPTTQPNSSSPTPLPSGSPQINITPPPANPNYPFTYQCPVSDCYPLGDSCPTGENRDWFGTCGSGKCCVTSTPTPSPILRSGKKGAGLAINFWCNSKQYPEKASCIRNVSNKVNDLNISWYYDWTSIYDLTKVSNIEYVPMIHGTGQVSSSEWTPDRKYSQEQLDDFKSIAISKRGSYWLVWNEPDLWYTDSEKRKIYDIDNNGTLDWIDAAKVAASIYKPLRVAIKAGDPSAKMIIGGVSGQNYYMYTEWPRVFLEEYRRINGSLPEYEGWHFHLYKCGNEYNKDLWRKQITDIRAWVDSNGGGNSKELWMTEFGCLFNETPEVTRSILNDNLSWLDSYSGLQRYSWFVGSSKEATGQSLFTNDLMYLFSGNPDTASFNLSSTGIIYKQ